jgi:hypothetical protein
MIDYEIKTGLVLLTKDGRVAGNAVVIGRAVDEKRWHIRTDFGNIGNAHGLTEREIHELFYLHREGQLPTYLSSQQLLERDRLQVNLLGVS